MRFMNQRQQTLSAARGRVTGGRSARSARGNVAREDRLFVFLKAVPTPADFEPEGRRDWGNAILAEAGWELR